MPYSVPCPKCKAVVLVPSKGSYGKRVKCPGCALDLLFSPATGQLTPVAAPAAQVPIPFPSAVPANPAVPVASLVGSGADGHAPKAMPVPVAEPARPAPQAALAPAKHKHVGKAPVAQPASAQGSHKRDGGAARAKSKDESGTLDFAAPGGIVAKPKLRGPGFIARWVRRIVRLGM